MNNISKFQITALFLTICLFCFAKPITILDGESNPVPGAYASLINATDSTIYDVAVSDAEGMVNFSSKPEAACDIYVKCLGYKPFMGAFSDELAEVVLEDDATELGEVVVKGSGSSLKRTAGKFIFDPSTLKGVARNGLDILRLAPLIEYQGSSFTIFGKGQSKVYINGRDPKMDINILIAELQALPPEQIKSVEIITSPGSSVSASFTGGIINVIVDQPNQGYRGNLNSSTRYYNERVSESASLWNGYTKDKINFSLTTHYSGNANHYKRTSVYDYSNTNRSVLNQTSYSSWSDAVSGRLSAQYNFTPKSTIGVAFSVSASHSDATSHLHSTTSVDDKVSISDYEIKSKTPWSRPYLGVVGYYFLLTDNKGSYLDITAAYGSNKSISATDYKYPDNPESEETSVANHGYNFFPKYLWKINKAHTLETGVNIYSTKINNDYIANINSNQFIYTELISSGYAKWDAKWNDAFSTNVGLRLENTYDKGRVSNSEDNFKHNYTDIYPSMSFSLNLPWRGNQNISIDISRRISRPFYSKLNPFVYWTSETTCSKGNINQRPSYGWNFSLYYSFLNDFVFNSSFRTWDNARLDYTYKEGDVTVSSTKNFGRWNKGDIRLSYNRLFWGFWRLKAEVGASFDQFNASLDGDDLSTNSAVYSLNLQNNITLSKSKKIFLEIYYMYCSPWKSIGRSQTTKNNIYLTFSKWFDNGMTVSMELWDLIHRQPHWYYSSPQYSYSERESGYPITVMIKFSYTFGKKRVTGAYERASGELDTRLKPSL